MPIVLLITVLFICVGIYDTHKNTVMANEPRAMRYFENTHIMCINGIQYYSFGHGMAPVYDKETLSVVTCNRDTLLPPKG